MRRPRSRVLVEEQEPLSARELARLPEGYPLFEFHCLRLPGLRFPGYISLTVGFSDRATLVVDTGWGAA